MPNQNRANRCQYTIPDLCRNRQATLVAEWEGGSSDRRAQRTFRPYSDELGRRQLECRRPEALLAERPKFLPTDRSLDRREDHPAWLDRRIDSLNSMLLTQHSMEHFHVQHHPPPFPRRLNVSHCRCGNADRDD